MRKKSWEGPQRRLPESQCVQHHVPQLATRTHLSPYGVESSGVQSYFGAGLTYDDDRMELQILQSYTAKLVIAVGGSINTVSDKCHSRGLICEDTYSHVLHCGETDEIKARYLLKAVKNAIKNDLSFYETFIKILNEELPASSKKVLDDMKKDLEEEKERRKVTECTDDYKRAKKGGTSTPLRVVEVRKQPVQVSDSSGGKSAYLPNSSARQTVLRHALELIQTAQRDAQQDEAILQELREENAKLNEECKQLKKAVKKEKHLKKKLEEQQTRLQTLVKEKENENADLKHELDEMKERMSGTEIRKSYLDSKCSELETMLSQVESDYDKEIAKLNRVIDDLQEKLQRQKLMTNEKENAVSALSQKVNELIQQNQELLRQHNEKDLELQNERRKSTSLEQQKHELLKQQSETNEECSSLRQKLYPLEHGFHCSQLAQFLVLWVVFVLLGILIISVAVYRYVFNTPHDPNNLGPRTSDL